MLHIDLPSRADIERLAAHRGAPAVSIYVKTHPVTQHGETDRLELARLMREVVEQAEAAGIDKRAMQPIESAVRELVDDHEFWAVQANTLAVLATPDSFQTFRLPNKIQSRAEVSDRFHLKPLLRSLTFPHTAYVLTLSLGAVRLIEISPDLPPEELEVPGLPKDVEEATGVESRNISRGTGRDGQSLDEAELLTRYVRRIDTALRPFLRGHERPLIIAAAEPLGSHFRSVSSYPNTARQIIAGNHDRTPLHEIAAAARKVLDEIYADEIRDLKRLYEERLGEHRATSDVSQAARAATFGAIDTLIFDIDDVEHGTVDDTDGRVSFAGAPGVDNYGIVDEIAVRALRTGARVVAARRDDIPGGGSLAAILRYPL
ncbi:MAG TPA: hypothetical protein VK022_04255 [Paracoccaceae bacterium]|nr:hypothetical protein [Paracoccaceae bacterium]